MRKNQKQSELQRVDVAPFMFSPAAPSHLECTQSLKLNAASLSIADPRPAVSAAFTIPVQQEQQRQKCCRSHPNTRGSAGIETSQRSVKWPSPAPTPETLDGQLVFAHLGASPRQALWP